MMIKIGGTDTIAAAAEPLALVAAMIVKLGPYEKPALIKLAEASIGASPAQG
jgi:hypothetical protein